MMLWSVLSKNNTKWLRHVKHLEYSKNLPLFFLFFLFFFSVLANSAFAEKDVVFSLNQSEYYFRVGEEARIPLIVKNGLDNPVDGMLSYTMTQEINQGGFHYSSSSTQSKSLVLERGERTLLLGFGSSDSPLTLKVDFSYVFNNGTDERVVDLDGVLIHFVSDNTSKTNNAGGGRVQSSSKKYTPSQAQQQWSDSFFQQQEKEMKKMEEMIRNTFGQGSSFGGGIAQQRRRMSAQQQLQNNQLSQDSAALKQQIQEQLRKKEVMKKEFRKAVSKNKEFQAAHQRLVSQGFNLTNAHFDPSSNDSGRFRMDYKKPDGEQLTLKGEMQNDVLKNLQEFNPVKREQMLSALKNDKRFKRLQEHLLDNGFKEAGKEFFQKNNNTGVKVNFINKNNKTSAIQAFFKDGNVSNVKLVENAESEEKRLKFFLLSLLFLFVLGLSSYLIYLKLKRNRKATSVSVSKKPVEKAVFDHKLESKKLLEKSKKLFAQKKFKDAYGLAAQALRLFLSFENGLKKEITNDEIIDFLRKHGKAFKDAKACFDLCSLVEFAKYHANRKDFDKIVSYVEKIVG